MGWPLDRLLDAPTDCYACYYMMYIFPTECRQAKVSTCCTNIEKKTNYVITPKDIKKTWNSRNFKHQRYLTSQSNWSYCWGHKCMPFRMYPQFNDWKELKDVQKAILSKETTLDYLPKAIWIIPSFECNHFCSFCYQKDVRKNRKAYALSDDLCMEVIKELAPHAKFVAFSGGEPFFTSAHLINHMLDYCPDVQVGVGTNGTLLHKFGLERIIANNMHLTISVYSMEEKTYNQMTGTSNYNYFNDNLMALLAMNYGHNIRLDYMVRDTASLKNMTFFLDFLREHPTLSGIIRDDHWSDARYQKQINTVIASYPDLAQRLKLYFRGIHPMMRNLTKLSNVICDAVSPMEKISY